MDDIEKTHSRAGTKNFRRANEASKLKIPYKVSVVIDIA